MKAKPFVSSVLAAAMLAMGAGSAFAADAPAKVPAPKPAIVKPLPGGSLYPPDKNCWIPAANRIHFEKIEIEKAPQEIQDWVNSLKETGGQGAKTVGEKTYVLYAAGQKPTGGYTADVTSIVKNGNKLVVTTNLETPQSDAEKEGAASWSVTQALTYPFALVVIDKTDLAIEFKPIGQKVTPKPPIKLKPAPIPKHPAKPTPLPRPLPGKSVIMEQFAQQR